MSVDAARSWLHVSGPKAGPTVVLVHGSVLNRQMWQPQIPALEPEFRVIAPDLPGHGALREAPFSIDASVAWLAKLHHTEDFASAIWVGTSMGGFITMALARRHPEQVAGLVLSGCSMRMTGLTRWWLKLVAAPLMDQLDGNWGQRRMSARVRTLFGASDQAAAEATIRAGLTFKPTARFFREAVAADFRDGLRGFAQPVLILNGERDRASCRGAADLAAIFPRSEVQSIERAGHACSLEQPAAFNAAVLRFARHAAASAIAGATVE